MLIYSGCKIRFAKLYSCIDDLASYTEPEYLNHMCRQLSSHMDILRETFSIVFNGDEVRLEQSDAGDYIRYPDFDFVIDDIKARGTIKVNPCFLKETPNGYRTHSKIWCNIKNKDTFKKCGVEIHQLLEQGRDFCKDVIRSVGNLYIDLIKNSQEILEYWVSIESIPIDNKTQHIVFNDLSSLFYFDNKKAFFDSYKNSPIAKETVSDLCTWVYNSEVEDPLERIKNDKEIDWLIAEEDSAKVLFSQENKEHYFRIVGTGLNQDPDHDDVFILDKSFKDQIETIIEVL